MVVLLSTVDILSIPPFFAAVNIDWSTPFEILVSPLSPEIGKNPNNHTDLEVPTLSDSLI